MGSSRHMPIEIRDRYLLSRKEEEEISDELGDDEIKSQKAKLHEQRSFYRTTMAADLLALLRFGVEQGTGECSEEELSALCQQAGRRRWPRTIARSTGMRATTSARWCATNCDLSDGSSPISRPGSRRTRRR